ncbi:hypothetical protein HYALB_00013542 [Hymenoscyphus albidus]|uniref:Uncharacterized protein n=1 Tax=Hymenoscyphus albidus TaxID=595503 RepID=A0A9N9Q9L8_9HELO|nr:hypothetical protein HYALB_00013542 [Hymenoscyphus albidus]
MAYGSLLWRIFAARKWRERLGGLIGDQVTLPITDRTYQKRNQFKKSADFARRNSAIQTEDVLTIAIDNLGIRSLEVLDSWPSAITDQAKRHEVYVVEKISNFHRRLCPYPEYRRAPSTVGYSSPSTIVFLSIQRQDNISATT